MTKTSMHKYVIVTPVRDEEEYIERTISCVVQQTCRPLEWIIVDDGSSDRTAHIIDTYAREYHWIRAIHRVDRGRRMPGSGVMEAFQDGYGRLSSTEWDFIVKLDGDVGLSSDYFERCFERFERDPKLGMCGGVMYCYTNDGKLRLESNPTFHVRGPIKLYRRACWEAIGGLITAPGWDTVDEVQANRLGWRTQSFADVRVIHYRPTGAVQGAWRDGVKMGKAAYVSGYHPLFMAAKCFERLFRKPYLLCSASHCYGFLAGYVKRLPRIEDEAYIRYIHAQQIRRLFFMDSIWR